MDPRLKVISKIDGFTIYEVDGNAIRSEEKGKNFTNFAHHYLFDFIPIDELWIDREASSDEKAFYITHMLIEYRLMAKGMPYEKALEIADRSERAERAKALGRVEGKNAPIERIKPKQCGTIRGKKVCLVSGKAVRDILYVEFSEGGHSLVYGFVPENTIWIDNDVLPEERPLILLHELYEMIQMEKGLSYNEAHEKALDIEWRARCIKKELKASEEIDLSKYAKDKDHDYVSKKKEESGNITYLYDEKHIAARNRKKEKRLQKLNKSLKNMRSEVKKDLTSDDDKTRLVALAIALIDETYERIGNEESASELKHYGVTGWLLKHVSFGKGKATIKYVGKAGVKQQKEIKDKAILTALKRACEDKSKGDRILDGISAKAVNAYLHQFGITAKDIRGFHANKEMLRSLKENGKGKLPKDGKEREKVLKERFKDALEDAAKKVGHEPSTLKRQYLLPRIEQNFLEGKGIRNILASQQIPLSKRAIWQRVLS